MGIFRSLEIFGFCTCKFLPILILVKLEGLKHIFILPSYPQLMCLPTSTSTGIASAKTCRVATYHILFDGSLNFVASLVDMDRIVRGAITWKTLNCNTLQIAALAWLFSLGYCKCVSCGTY